MQEQRLIYMLRVANYWREPRLKEWVDDFAWSKYLEYKALGLADLSAVPTWEILSGDEVSDDEMDVAGTEDGLPYFCIWEVTGTIDEEGKPIDQPAEAPEKPTEPEPEPDRTGKPAFTADDINEGEE